MKFPTVLSLAALLAPYALGVDIAFMQGEGCGGQPLYGIKGLTEVNCYNVAGDEKAASVHLGRLHKGQQVRFFSDAACKKELYKTSEGTCYTSSDGAVGSFAVTVPGGTASEKRAAEAQSESTTDLVEYGVKLSNYKGLDFAPASVDLRYSNSFIGVLALATASALSFSAGVVGCYSAITSGGALSIYSCIAGPISTILSYVAYHFLARAGRDINDNIRLATGTITSGTHRKRDQINAANFEYMHSAMNVTDSPAVHTGKVMRRDFESGSQESPIYELEGGDGVIYHMTAFYDEESDSFMHHLAPEHQSHELTKRVGPGYNNVRWSSGGMDFSFCNFNAGSSRANFKNRSLQTLYNTYYEDLQCLISPNDLKSKQQLLVDMYNGDSVIVGEVNIAPFKQGGPVNNNRYVIGRCSDRKGTINQSCIN